jgi:hypothetical protein
MEGDSIARMQDEDRQHREAWRLGEYAGVCAHCGRERLCVCANGQHRCEKCNWCPELDDYAPVS